MVLADRTATAMERTLPGRYFVDPEIYRREQAAIFAAMWVCVCRADELPDVGDYLTTEIAGESVIVVRTKGGELRAHLNVCRHRGARICTEDHGNCGQVLQCRYHAWSYALDGRLVGAPNLKREEGLNPAEMSLFPAHLKVWQGLIWVSIADDPGLLADQIEPPILKRLGSTEKFDRWGMGDLVLGKRITYDVASNWKIVVENFMECYHCGPVHPELCRLLPDFNNGISYQGLPGEGTEFADDISLFSLSGTGTRDKLPGITPEEDRQYFAFVLWPNVFVNLLPDHVIVHIVQPTGVDTSRVICDWIFAADEVASPGFDPSDTVDAFHVTNEQDWMVSAWTQLGMSSKAFAQGGVFVANERHIAAFRDFILDRVGDL